MVYSIVFKGEFEFATGDRCGNLVFWKKIGGNQWSTTFRNFGQDPITLLTI